MKLKTVKVKHEDGFKIINKDDFDPKKDELFEAKKARQRKVKNGD